MGSVFISGKGSNMNTGPNISIEKLDGRFVGHQYFKYRIYFSSVGKTNRFLQFVDIRNWLWDTYGSSSERDIILYLEDFKNTAFNKKWAWHVDDKSRDNVYIYLASDEELALFKLKWM